MNVSRLYSPGIAHYKVQITSGGEPVLQQRVLPLPIASIAPSPLGTADCKCVGTGLDGVTYVIKRVADGTFIPLSEYLCSTLAAQVGVAVPPYAVVEMPGGELAFGSRWEAGILGADRTVPMLLGIAPPPNMDAKLAAIWAFDLFVGNVDRHYGNYFIRRADTDASELVVMAPDFSRAFMATGWPLPDLPLPPGSHTVQRRAEIVRRFGTNAAASNEIVDRLAALGDGLMDSILSHVPRQWLDTIDATVLTTWWSADGRRQRIDATRAILKNEEAPDA